MYFSIIIPLYNKQDYIAKTINSILNQTHNDFELIIIDDGSTDNSLDVVKRYDDIRIIIVEQVNQGVSKTRNNGVQLAKYDFIAFLDADDWWEPAFLECIAKSIVLFPNAGVYASNYQMVYEHLKSPVVHTNLLSSEISPINYFSLYLKVKESPIHISSLVVRKTCFIDVGGFNYKLKLGEDMDLWIRLSLKYSIIFIDKILSNYNHVVDTKQRGSGILRSKEESLVFNLVHLKEIYPSNKDLKIFVDYICLAWLKPYYVKSLYLSDIKSILKLISNKPFKFTVFYSLPPKILRMPYKIFTFLKK